MVRNKRILWPGLLVLMLALTLPVFAAAFTLTISPREVETDAPMPGERICLRRIARVENGNYVLEEPFSMLPLETLLSPSGNQYAGQVRDYVLNSGMAVTRRTTNAQGDAVFEGLEPGLFLVFPEREGMFAPFFITVTNRDVVSEPKGVLEPTPPTTRPTTEPTKPRNPWLPQTGDLFPLEAFLACALFSLGGLIVLLNHRKDQEDEGEADTGAEPQLFDKG